MNVYICQNPSNYTPKSCILYIIKSQLKRLKKQTQFKPLSCYGLSFCSETRGINKLILPPTCPYVAYISFAFFRLHNVHTLICNHNALVV